jgi:hypothetical protein
VSRLDDLNCNCKARQVLVRHWINLGKASLRTTNGVLSIHGTLEKLPHGGALTASSVAELATELRRVVPARRVSLNFTNWIERDGAWRSTTATSSAPGLRRKGSAQEAVYEINESELPRDISELV